MWTLKRCYSINEVDAHDPCIRATCSSLMMVLFDGINWREATLVEWSHGSSLLKEARFTETHITTMTDMDDTITIRMTMSSDAPCA